MSNNKLRAMYAVLFDHFRLRPWEVGRLTDRQIIDLYFHARKEDGSIEPLPEPQRPGTLAYELAKIDALSHCGIPAAKLAEMKHQVKERFGGGSG